MGYKGCAAGECFVKGDVSEQARKIGMVQRCSKDYSQIWNSGLEIFQNFTSFEMLWSAVVHIYQEKNNQMQWLKTAATMSCLVIKSTICDDVV